MFLYDFPFENLESGLSRNFRNIEARGCSAALELIIEMKIIHFFQFLSNIEV